MKNKIKILVVFIVFCFFLGFNSSVSFADESENAKKINVNEKVKIREGDDEGWYEFTLLNDGYINMIFQGDDMSRSIYLYESDKKTCLLWEYGKGYYKSSEIGLAAGTYYIDISVYSEGTCYLEVDYTKDDNWEKEKNDTYQYASNINVNEAYYGTIHDKYYDDCDWYKFTIPDNGMITISFSHEINTSQYTYWYIDLYKSNGTSNVVYGTNFEVTGNKNYNSPEIGLKAGTYYLKITDDYTYYDDSVYELSVNYTKSENWEKEPNDNYEADSIYEIKLGERYKGALISWADNDTYKINLLNETSLKMTLSHEKIGDGDYCWYLAIYDKNHEYIESVALYDSKKTVELKIDDLDEGLYYIEVDGLGTNFSSETYTLKVDDVSKDSNTIEKDNNDSTATVSNVGKKFANYQGYDFYKDNDGDVRAYDASNNIVINDFKCDGEFTYYFQADGTAMKDRLTYHPDGVHVIYFDSEGHEVFSNFANVKRTISGDAVDDYCFFDVFGYLYVDVVTYDTTGTKIYYANAYGVMEHGKWFRFSDKAHWAGTDELKDGEISEFSGQYGYANDDCTLLINVETSDWNGISCYLQGNGVALY